MVDAHEFLFQHSNFPSGEIAQLDILVCTGPGLSIPV
jgi:hypothetical protein